MTTLAGNSVKDAYKRLLQVPDATTGLTASLQYILDGDGTQSPLQVSTSAVSIDSLTCTGGLTISTGNLSVAAGTITAATGLTVSSGDCVVSSGNITVSGTVDGRDIATDGTKLDGIEANADVTDETNVVAALDGATLTAATVASTDKILGQDVDDSDNIKTFTAQSIANTASSLAASVITSGTFADARIAESNVTQHQTAINNAVDDATMTFTNKTFDANGTGNSLSNVDVADLATGTDGELITWDSSGNPTTVSVGTAGQVLTSNGAGAAPTFQNASGTLVLLETQTASNSATIDFENLLDSTYDVYMLKISALVPATDSVNIRITPGTGATPTWQTAIPLTATNVGNDTGECFNGTIHCYDPSDTGVYTLFKYDLAYMSSAAAFVGVTNGTAFTNTAAVTSLRIDTSSGNITSGNFSLYAIKK